MIKSVKNVNLYVDDLRQGIGFYRTFKGLQLLWQTEHMAGLGFDSDITELILQDTPIESSFCLECEGVNNLISQIEMMGGSVIKGPFEVKNGIKAIIKDPFGNVFQIQDLSKGDYLYDEDGNIVGKKKSDLIEQLSHFILDK